GGPGWDGGRGEWAGGGKKLVLEPWLPVLVAEPAVADAADSREERIDGGGVYLAVLADLELGQPEAEDADAREQVGEHAGCQPRRVHIAQRVGQQRQVGLELLGA